MKIKCYVNTCWCMENSSFGFELPEFFSKYFGSQLVESRNGEPGNTKNRCILN